MLMGEMKRTECETEISGEGGESRTQFGSGEEGKKRMTETGSDEILSPNLRQSDKWREKTEILCVRMESVMKYGISEKTLSLVCR